MNDIKLLPTTILNSLFYVKKEADSVYKIDITIDGEKLPIPTLYDSMKQVQNALQLWELFFAKQKHGELAQVEIVEVSE